MLRGRVPVAAVWTEAKGRPQLQKVRGRRVAPHGEGGRSRGPGSSLTFRLPLTVERLCYGSLVAVRVEPSTQGARNL